MPSFFNPARDSRHRAACFALYRALLREVPHISLPAELTSRPDWINPVRYLIRTGFRRNKTDTSARLVTSALTSGYRILTLLHRARDTSSASYTEVLTFLRDRHAAFPPPRPPAPAPVVKPKPPPLLTKISAPGDHPLYVATVRPLPLEQLSGGKRKIPVIAQASGSIPFLRIGKPQSHTHSNFLKRKSERRQNRITLVKEMKDEVKVEARTEDRWEAALRRLAQEEGVDIGEGEGGCDNSVTFEQVVQEFGLHHLKTILNVEAEDLQARTTALLDLRDEEQRLAVLEKKERDEKRRKAWEEKVKQLEEQESSVMADKDKSLAERFASLMTNWAELEKLDEDQEPTHDRASEEQHPQGEEDAQDPFLSAFKYAVADPNRVKQRPKGPASRKEG